MPLVNSFVLSTKKNHEAYIDLIFDESSNRFNFEVKQGVLDKSKEVKAAKGAFKCAKCNTLANNNYLHEQFMAGQDGRRLIAVVAEGNNGRLYLSPDDEQVKASMCDLPEKLSRAGDESRDNGSRQRTRLRLHTLTSALHE